MIAIGRNNRKISPLRQVSGLYDSRDEGRHELEPALHPERKRDSLAHFSSREDIYEVTNIIGTGTSDQHPRRHTRPIQRFAVSF